MATLCTRSITVNLTPKADAWVRRQAKKRRVSMNALINEAMETAMAERETNAEQTCVGRNTKR